MFNHLLVLAVMVVLAVLVTPATVAGVTVALAGGLVGMELRHVVDRHLKVKGKK